MTSGPLSVDHPHNLRFRGLLPAGRFCPNLWPSSLDSGGYIAPVVEARLHRGCRPGRQCFPPTMLISCIAHDLCKVYPSRLRISLNRGRRPRFPPRNPKLRTRSSKFETRNLKPETRNSKPNTLNPTLPSLVGALDSRKRPLLLSTRDEPVSGPA